MKSSLISKTAAALGLVLCASGASALATPWQFGLISDTQWVNNDDGYNPDSTAASIIKAIDAELIKRQVKVVVSVGDQMDDATNASFDTRALYAQDLYNAGIPYYSLRGNHDAGLAGSGSNQAYVFPQLVNGGINNLTPSILTPAYIDTILNSADLSYTTAAHYLTDTLTYNPPAISNGVTFSAGSNFSYAPTNGVNCSPAGWPVNSGNNNYSAQYGSAIGNGGLSYSFDVANVRFIMIDQFVDSSLGGNTSAVSLMQPWITARLADAARPTQAILFSHKMILGGNHKDNLFGTNIVSSDPGDGYGVTGLSGANQTAMTAKQQAEDAFITAMVQNNARYVVHGHDHHHCNSVVKSPLSNNSVHQLITQSSSSKFYTPGAPYSGNETSVSEDLYEVGYYLFTVDGPRMTIDYYAVPVNCGGASVGELTNTAYGTPATPVMTGNWVKEVSAGYSLNGKEFLVAEGASYTTVSDNTANAIAHASTYGESDFVGTSMSILSGINGSTMKTADGRALTKAVNTGWAPASSDATGSALSDILTLWGLTDLGAISTDTIAVSVSLPAGTDASQLANGSVCLGVQVNNPATGTPVWINAVDDNLVGGKKQFVYGPYSSSYGLGTYGIDPVAGTAWAVVNGDARVFAIINTPTAPLPWDFNATGDVNTADLTVLARAVATKSTNPMYDLNGDGKVNAADETWLSKHFTNVGGK